MRATQSFCHHLLRWIIAASCLLWVETLQAQSGRTWVDPPERSEPIAPPPAPEAPAPTVVPEAVAPRTEPKVDTEIEPRRAPKVESRPAGPVSSERRPPEAEPEREPRAADRSRPEPPRQPPRAKRPTRLEAADQAAEAEEFAADYLRTWSEPNVATVEAMQAFYAPEVIYHGRRMSTRALLDEKRRFMQRWPVREYVARPETMRTSCAGPELQCTVRTAFDFRAASPQTGKLSQGSAILLLEVSFATGRPLIVVENSQVTSRSRGAGREAFEDDDEP